jgi:hypothetical protein
VSRHSPVTAALVRFELRRAARSWRSWLGLGAAVTILAADNLLRDAAARAEDSLFVLAFVAALVTAFRTGWADDRSVAFDELLIPGLVHPRGYFLARVVMAALWIAVIAGVTTATELLLGDPRAALWYGSYCLLAAWLFTPVALWAEHHSRLRWPMVFPIFLYVTANLLASVLGGADALRDFIGLAVSRYDFGSLAPALWRSALVVPLLLLALYLHAFPRGFREGDPASRSREMEPSASVGRGTAQGG